MKIGFNKNKINLKKIKEKQKNKRKFNLKSTISLLSHIIFIEVNIS